jgi:hypothetical protein
MLAEDQRGSVVGGTRLRMVPIEQFDPELRQLVAADERTPLELGLLRVHAHRPSHAKAIVGLHAALWTDRLLPDRLADAVLALHQLEAVVDLVERDQAVRDERGRRRSRRRGSAARARAPGRAP